MTTARAALLALAALLAACKGYSPKGFKEPQKLGGKEVPADVLAEGEQAYVQYCRACHGDAGDGKGPAARGLRPPPRDFTLGVFKFASVPAGTLPVDEDLHRIVRSGLHGTAMLAWNGVPEEKVQQIIQYLKTFSPRWKEEEPGEPIPTGEDPWKGRGEEAAARGKLVYHGLARCQGCHPAYGSKAYIYEATKELTGTPSADFRDEMYLPDLLESDYGVKIMPPDFTFSELRSIRPDHRLQDLHRVISAGVGGTAMPTWHGSLPEEDIWAMVHFVDSLIARKGRPDALRWRDENRAADEKWKPPPEPAAPGQ
jgi:mono/diheme cytochrome c family protein